MAGKLEEVQEMAAEVCMADINTSSILLFLAADSRSAPIAKILLSSGASILGRDASNMTVLHRCQVGDGHSGVTIAKLFLDTNPNLLNEKDEEERTALFMAVENNHRRMTRMLLERGADANIHDRCRRTCLHLAVESCTSERLRNDRSLEMVKSLLKHGADPNTRDNTDKTPLYLACDLGNVEIVDQLLQAGADVNGRGVLDETPLIAAVKHLHIPVVRRLVALGANLILRDKQHKDVFSYATGPRRLELLRALPGSHT